MEYRLLINNSDYTETHILYSDDLEKLLTMRDKLNGDHPDYPHKCLADGNYAMVVEGYYSRGVMGWDNIIAEDRPNYVEEFDLT